MSGSDDYHLQVIARDIADFERIHKQHLSRMPGVARIPFELCDARSGSQGDP
jgi:DNA-binding Lrp family transcriptional regulator